MQATTFGTDRPPTAGRHQLSTFILRSIFALLLFAAAALAAPAFACAGTRLVIRYSPNDIIRRKPAMPSTFHRFRRLSTALLLAALPAAAHAGQARFDSFSYTGRMQHPVSVKPGEYRNPILAGYHPDPSITRVGDDYYLVNSSFANYPGLPVFTSRDLVHWTQIGNAIDRPGQLDFTGRGSSQAVFAPDISWHDGTFYIVNTCVGCKGNFVITATNPAGPWSDPIWLPFEGIDPSIYWEGDHAYIVNNRAPAEPAGYEGHRAIWLQEYDWRAGKMVGDSVEIVDGGTNLADKPIWIEGPHLFKKDGTYYLIAAQGGTGANHSEVVFRSKKLRGPYTPFAGNPILTQRGLPANRPDPISSAGHADFVQTQKGDWWATFLATQPYADDLYNTGRETFLLPVTWADGWPHILPEGKPVPLVATAPDLAAQPATTPPTTGDFAYTDDFNETALLPQWLGLRIPKQPFYHLANGALLLDPGKPFGDLQSTPSFIGRRQQQAIATVSTVMHYTPDHDGDRAGLAAMQSDKSYVFFGVTRIDGQPRIAVYSRDKANADTLVASAPIDPAQTIGLTMRIDGGTMAFDYRVGGRERTLTSNVSATLLSTQQAGGFVGTIIGLYSANGSKGGSDG